jgi:formylglycine-generating enzyme required for sulfatase activity
MIELLLTLTNTPLPALLAVSGLILLFLGIVGYIEQLKIQPMPLGSRIAAGIVGVVLLVLSIGLYVAPTLLALPANATPAATVTEAALQATESATEAALTEVSSEVNEQGYPTMIDATGSRMVRIPAGTFTMGSDSGFSDEQPVHRVEITHDTWMDVYEVSNDQYKACADAGVCDIPNKINSVQHVNYYGNPEFANFPVVEVGWKMAQTFCQDWRKGHLPTEAEWEYAARGTDLRKYTWSNTLPDCDLANFKASGYCVSDTNVVDSHPRGVSPFGLYNMAGNVWEWVADGYGPYAGLPLQDPLGTGTSADRVRRGGGWGSDGANITTTVRWPGHSDAFDYSVGFRCAATP